MVTASPFYPSLHHCNNSFQIMIILCNYVRCVHRARAEQESENASKGQKYTKTIKQNTPKYSFSQPPRWTLNSYKLSPSQYIPPHGSVCYITTCSLTMLNDIFPDQKQVHFSSNWIIKVEFWNKTRYHLRYNMASMPALVKKLPQEGDIRAASMLQQHLSTSSIDASAARVHQ